MKNIIISPTVSGGTQWVRVQIGLGKTLLRSTDRKKFLVKRKEKEKSVSPSWCVPRPLKGVENWVYDIEKALAWPSMWGSNQIKSFILCLGVALTPLTQG